MRGYIKRFVHDELQNSLSEIPVTALLGPRQCGKSTLAKEILATIPDSIHLDLERPSDLRALSDPEAFFKINEDKLICIDEIQNVPELFPAIRYEVDRRGENGQFLLLGSASPLLIRQSSESLAGRIYYRDLSPFMLSEIKQPRENLRTLWLRGGFPRSYLSAGEKSSTRWRINFIRTFLERDIPSLGINISTGQIRRLWTMLAHSSGQIVNYSKLSESLGISRNTVKNYIDILEQTYMIRVLPPYISNTKKRLVKSPKVYIRDTGVLHTLLEIESQNELISHPVYGQSWESFALENITTALSDLWRSSFYRSEKGNEIDLILEKGNKKICIEFKSSTAPKVTRGFWTALEDLKPDESWIIAPVERVYPINSEQRVFAGNISDFLEHLRTK